MQDYPSSKQAPAGYAAPPPAKRKNNLLVTAAVLAVIAGGVGGAIWLAHKPQGPAAAGGGRGGRPSTTVGVATATESDIPITIEGLGTVTPSATVTVTPQVSGVITQILYKEGQTVQKGDTLAVIDPRPLQNALNQAQGQLARDQAQLTNAKSQLERDKTLLAQDSIARQDVDTQTALVGQLEGTIQADTASVGTAQLNLGFSRVIAPVSGRVGLRPVDLGNFIGAGASGGVAVITQVNPIDVAFTIPQVDLPRVQANAARCDLQVEALDQSKTITLDEGVFSTLDNRIDTTTGTVKAKARFNNAKNNLFPNQFVNVRLNIETLHNAVIVPVTAVRTGPKGDFVWVLQPDKTVKQRTVKRGPGTVDSTSITEGLEAGEQVITEGGDRLTEDAKVTLPGDRPAPAATAGGRGGRGGARGGRGGRRGGQAAQGGAQAGGQAAAGGAQGEGGGQRNGGQGANAQGAGGRDAAAQGSNGRAGNGGATKTASNGGSGQKSGCYSAPRSEKASGDGKGQGGRQGNGGNRDAAPAQGQGQGRGSQNRQRGGNSGGNQDVNNPQRRQRPAGQNGQGARAGQGGGQSNGG